MQLNKLFAVSILSMAIMGCASSGGTDEGTSSTENSVEESQTQAVPESPDVDVVTEEQAGGQAEGQTANPLLKQTLVYFGYDRAEIRPEFKDVLNAHAGYLVANPQSRMVLEGHCDERGTVEYNLALGERRANTVKRYLVVQGVNPSQLESVSFGEERPAMIGSDDASWSKNRRTEIKYQAQ